MKKNQVLQQLPRHYFELSAVLGLVLFIIFSISNGENLNNLVAVLSVFLLAAFRLIPSCNRMLANVHAIKYGSFSIDFLFNELNKINSNNDLSLAEMQNAINSIMTGQINDVEIESFLIGLNKKGISEEEITAAAMVMKDKSLKFDIGDGSHIDTCGTGGTGLHTFNCSTASSFVAAAGGAKITKHGNKAISSKSGSADFLEEAGANISHDRKKLYLIFDQVGFIFLFAPLHHQAMKYVMPVRQKIAEKTIFNLLGPHTNPCNAKRQVLGVYNKKLVRTFSNVAKNLDMEHVLIVHGDDGLDEITISSETLI